MFKSFRKRNSEKNTLFNQVQEQRKEDLESFVLILEKIQEANNQSTKGKGSFFKNYKQKQTLVDNLTTLALEKTNEKIKELG